MFCGLNAKKKRHCLISNIENLVAKIRSVKFSFLLSIFVRITIIIDTFTRSTKQIWCLNYPEKDRLKKPCGKLLEITGNQHFLLLHRLFASQSMNLITLSKQVDNNGLISLT